MRARLARLRWLAGELRPFSSRRADDRGAPLPSRIKLCGCAPVDHGHPSLVVRTARGHRSAGVVGVQTCGSVWECASCAGVIMRDRARDVQHVVNHAHGEQRGVWLVSLTVRHSYGDDLREMRLGIARAWSGVINGAPWQRRRDRFGLEVIRRLESTVGGNGWHPHLHLIVTSSSDPSASDWAWLAARWDVMVARHLGPQHVGEAPHAFDVQRVRAGDAASKYLCKLGLELTDAFARKRSAAGGYTPWGLLARVESEWGRDETGEGRWCRDRWAEWAAAMKRAQSLTWSRGMRRRVGLVDLEPDAVIAEREALDGLPEVVIPHEHASRILGRPWVRVPLLGMLEDGASILELAQHVATTCGHEAAFAFEVLNDSRGEHLAAVREHIKARRAALEHGLLEARAKKAARVPFDPDTWFRRALEGHVRGDAVAAVRRERRARREAALADRLAEWESLGRMVDREFLAWSRPPAPVPVLRPRTIYASRFADE